MKYCYCIFYIERKYYKRINEELKSKGYKHIKAIIPEVSVLKKTLKNTTFYEEVPVLFSYGFMKMPVDKAFSRTFLNKLKKDISGIRNWLRSCDTMFPRKKRKRTDNMEDFDDFSKVAICTRDEMRRFKKIAKYNIQYSIEDRTSIYKGQYVQLKICPYDGLWGKVTSINQKKKTVTLELSPLSGKFIVTLPMDHVIYSVYKDHDPDTFIKPYNLDENRV